MLSLTINFQRNIVCESLCTHPYPQIYRDPLRDRDLARGLGKNTSCCRPFLIESVSQSVSLPQRRGPYARVNTRLVVLILRDRMVALSTESESSGEASAKLVVGQPVSHFLDRESWSPLKLHIGLWLCQLIRLRAWERACSSQVLPWNPEFHASNCGVFHRPAHIESQVVFTHKQVEQNYRKR